MNAKRHAAENRKGQCASLRRALFLLCFGHGPPERHRRRVVAEGFTHIQCYCPRCRTTRLRPNSWLPRISLGLTIAAFSAATLRGVRWSTALGQAVAVGRRSWEAVGA